jgi:type I restriction enzyme S subunit
MKRPIIDSAEDQITPEAVSGSSTKMVPAGSIMCVMRSGILRHTFPVAVNTVDLTLNQDLRALIPDATINPLYLAHYLRSTGQAILDRCGKDGTTVNSIEADRLDLHPVPVPPPVVQQRIVARIDELLSEVEDGEAALARARADLATWRKALLKAAVTGELTADWRAANPPTETGADLLARILTERRTRWLADPRNKGKRYVEPAGPDAGDLPELPAGWAWGRFEQLITGLRNGISVKPAHSPPGVPIMRISAVRAMAVNASDRRWLPEGFDAGDSLARTGDLLFTRYNGSPELVGVCGRYRDADPIAYPDKVMCAGPVMVEGPLGDYLELAMNAGAARAFIKTYTKTSAGQHGVSGDTVKNAPVPLPPADEMAEIVSLFHAALMRANEGLGDLGPLEEGASCLRQSILAAAFRGEFTD